jgi:hypothetical protein
VEIISSLLEADSKLDHYLVVLDVLVDGKRLVAGLGVGDVHNQQPRLNLDSARCLHKMRRHHEQRFPDTASEHLVEIRTADHVANRVSQALTEAQQGDAVFFLCEQRLVYDGVFVQMNVQVPLG